MRISDEHAEHLRLSGAALTWTPAEGWRIVDEQGTREHIAAHAAEDIPEPVGGAV